MLVTVVVNGVYKLKADEVVAGRVIVVSLSTVDVLYSVIHVVRSAAVESTVESVFAAVESTGKSVTIEVATDSWAPLVGETPPSHRVDDPTTENVYGASAAETDWAAVTVVVAATVVIRTVVRSVDGAL